MLKTCKNCKAEKSHNDFSKGQKACKICRNVVAKTTYEQQHDRAGLRNELKLILMAESKGDEEWINNFYITKEKLKEMKAQKDRYEFCELPTYIREATRESYAEEISKGYFLDWIMMFDNVNKIGRTITII